MNRAYSLTFRGVDLRVDFNADDTINAVEAGGVDIRPLLSELLMDDLHAAIMERACADAENRMEGA